MESRRSYLRFPLAYRIEHWIIVLTFTTLAITGLIQKFAITDIAVWIVGLLGGIETVRIIHRIAAVVLILESIYHVGLVGYNFFVRRYKMSFLPTLKDATNAIQAIQYNLRLRNDRPQQGRYTFDEKFEYFGIVWGTLVMIVTGFILWNPIAATSILPGEFVPAAKVFHSGEALLAVLAILVWHMYHVHIRKFNKSMFTGQLSEEEMEEEHPLELAELKQAAPEAPSVETARKRRIYLMVYVPITLVSLAIVYVFVTFEQTAIDTVAPLESVEVYSPLEDAELQPVSFNSPMTSWEDGIGEFFDVRCSFCHGKSTAISDLDLTTYDSALLGGSSVPAIVPNDPENSGIIIQNKDRDHFVALTDEEFEKLTAWVEAGAPQN
ncbi:cytochrome b/b6 domain-containing protein [Phototrophicus methaneseepsis]|uniref:Cytochrome b/b6 domain-containing protein n=1 Tax=Phototrophicus methaneseepsis TaxID=2710758 RepID=A0A7S8EDK8_9CHLR|nr:cytochrome b/b6 domain-containing protein [Phototrophicus methaneseepsis]QPC84981.1 cytochrome b/b6 domain-containing protein [Phototrophicus methaneseepsis]